MVRVDACRPIVILAERDKLAMDAELEFILRECKIKVITREGQHFAATLSRSFVPCNFGQPLLYANICHELTRSLIASFCLVYATVLCFNCM